MEISPRPAATLLLLRDVPVGDIEVLMLRKNPLSEFASGAYVFPGGAVEDSDRHLARMPHNYRGLDDSAASAILDLEQGGLAYFAAAIREAFEEAGILMACDQTGLVDLSGDSPLAARLNRARESMNAGEIDFYRIVDSEPSLKLAIDELVYVSHWITPVGPPRRYDTRFFAARAPLTQTAIHEGGEIVDTIWISPREALMAASRKEMEIMFPTLRHLEMISDFTSVDEIIEWARQREVSAVLPRVVASETRIRIILPGEDGYEESFS